MDSACPPGGVRQCVGVQNYDQADHMALGDDSKGSDGECKCCHEVLMCSNGIWECKTCHATVRTKKEHLAQSCRWDGELYSPIPYLYVRERKRMLHRIIAKKLCLVCDFDNCLIQSCNMKLCTKKTVERTNHRKERRRRNDDDEINDFGSSNEKNGEQIVEQEVPLEIAVTDATGKQPSSGRPGRIRTHSSASTNWIQSDDAKKRQWKEFVDFSYKPVKDVIPCKYVPLSWDGSSVVVFLRPCCLEFLDACKNRFSISGYTHGLAEYALRVGNILLMKRSQITARELGGTIAVSDRTVGEKIVSNACDVKKLSRVFPFSFQRKMAIAIDDQPNVWEVGDCVLLVKQFTVGVRSDQAIARISEIKEEQRKSAGTISNGNESASVSAPGPVCVFREQALVGVYNILRFVNVEFYTYLARRVEWYLNQPLSNFKEEEEEEEEEEDEDDHDHERDEEDEKKEHGTTTDFEDGPRVMSILPKGWDNTSTSSIIESWCMELLKPIDRLREHYDTIVWDDSTYPFRTLGIDGVNREFDGLELSEAEMSIRTQDRAFSFSSFESLIPRSIEVLSSLRKRVLKGYYICVESVHDAAPLVFAARAFGAEVRGWHRLLCQVANSQKSTAEAESSCKFVNIWVAKNVGERKYDTVCSMNEHISHASCRWLTSCFTTWMVPPLDGPMAHVPDVFNSSVERDVASCRLVSEGVRRVQPMDVDESDDSSDSVGNDDEVSVFDDGRNYEEEDSVRANEGESEESEVGDYGDCVEDEEEEEEVGEEEMKEGGDDDEEESDS